jgi:hypothetical protein
MSTQDNIQNIELLTSIFGKVPSFHDSEVLRIVLDRGKLPEVLPSLTASIHAWTMTNESDEKGFIKLKNHTLVTLRFDGITDLAIDDFNHQNVLSELHFEYQPESSRFDVHLNGIFGIDTKFRCKAISVESAVPFATT